MTSAWTSTLTRSTTVQEMEALIALGVDGMFTNNPDRLEGLLGKSAAPGKRGATLAAEDYAACRAAA